MFNQPLRLFWKMNTRADEKRIATQTPDIGVTIRSDVLYVADGHCLYTLGIFYPDNLTEKLPIIMNIHGGGWMSGDKKVNRNFCIKFAKKRVPRCCGELSSGWGV